MTGTFLQPDFETQSGIVYKGAIDNSFAALARIGQMFAPHEQDTPDMTVRLDAGALLANVTLSEIAAQSTGTITAPSGTDHRIDRVVIDALTGAVSVITGTPGAEGAVVAPDITTGKLPICQVALAHDMTEITNDLITDERVMGGGAGEAIKINGIYQNLGDDPATELGYGTWLNLKAHYAFPEVDNFTKLLLHCDGVTTSFIDSATGKVITAGGTATQSSTQSKFGGKSLYLDGNSDYISIPDHDDFNMGIGDCTFDFWVYFNDITGEQDFIVQYIAASIGIGVWKAVTTHKLSFYIKNTGSVTMDNNWAPSTGEWYHIAVVRSDSGGYIFINGVSQAVTGSFNTTPTDGDGVFYIGGDIDNSRNYVNGYMDEIRISKGIARWTANFAPPVASYGSYPIDQRWLRVA